MKRKDRAIKKITNDLERLRISGQDDMVTDKAEALAKYTHKMGKIYFSEPAGRTKTCPKKMPYYNQHS